MPRLGSPAGRHARHFEDFLRMTESRVREARVNYEAGNCAQAVDNLRYAHRASGKAGISLSAAGKEPPSWYRPSVRALARVGNELYRVEKRILKRCVRKRPR